MVDKDGYRDNVLRIELYFGFICSNMLGDLEN